MSVANLPMMVKRLGLTCLVLWGAQQARAEEAIPYNKLIRPILADNCFACHGPDSASRKADLRLDKRDAAIEMQAIVPGDPEASQLVDRILRAEDDDLAMPPSEGHKRLSPADKELLTAWIRQGAVYEPHWSLIPPTKTEPPRVENAQWAQNPIDQFVLAELEAQGLEPAPEADRALLARRLALDLTGLPPTPQQVDQFVNDTSADYYLNYVNQLLDSPRWGEHRGRYWLDYARFADTHGIHFDNYREMWAYRDWVIGAFNRNLPFDQFTTEQLAGDLLPNPTLDQLIATGFNRCNITTNEGGIIDEEYKVLYARDRTETTSTVWLGITSGCAVCHDHKFDALTMHDFYSMSAFFNNTTQPVRDGNIPNTPPIIAVPKLEDRQRYTELPSLITAAEQTLQAERQSARAVFDQDDAAITADAVMSTLKRDDLIIHAPLAEGQGRTTFVLSDGQLVPTAAASDLKWGAGHTASFAHEIEAPAKLAFPQLGDFERDQAFSVAMWVWLPADNLGGALVARMDESNDYRGWDVWLEGGRFGTHIIHKWPDNALKVVAQDVIPQQRWTHLAVSYDGSSRPEGLKFFMDGRELTNRNIQKATLTESTRTNVPFRVGSRSSAAGVPGARLNDLRIYAASLDAPTVRGIATATRAAYLAALPVANREAADQDALFQWWLEGHAPGHTQAVAQVESLKQEKQAIEQRGTIAHVMSELSGPAGAFVLERGEYDKQRDAVTADTPSMLPPMPADFPKNRLGLARWLFLDDHPLTARVTVNRFWQEIFGRGLVETAGDFGISGTMPTNQPLLDYLAVQYRESGWDTKELFRLIVTSATYRQAALTTPEKLAADPQNIFFSRGTRYRMDAEMVRDYALAVSGLLSPTIGGASVRPYQPEGVWEAVAMPGSNTRDYVRDQGEGLYRRGMYTFWKRSAPPASMDIFNAPSRETCTVRRERTNTPLQALVTLNDPQFVEAARQLATAAIEMAGDDQTRIDMLMKRLVARSPQPAETKIILASLGRLRDHYSANATDAQALIQVGQSPTPPTMDPGELAAWTMLCNELLNLDEVLNK